MKVSEITIKNLANYLKLDYGSLAEEEILELAAFLQAAIRFICDYTGLSEADLDEHETFIIAVFVLVIDFNPNIARMPNIERYKSSCHSSSSWSFLFFSSRIEFTSFSASILA